MDIFGFWLYQATGLHLEEEKRRNRRKKDQERLENSDENDGGFSEWSWKEDIQEKR